ncbi:hypothetical protein BDB00DRAFT_984296 [Zychaea mexicana]|uniref:uncharacterized protein n=1 Tax=Zychaea mexicana TaxID=64656 RepID=UPI0022FE9F49|nr:uncharacterized protein BDB00DRAFT_984296 [Zychaea mexicana]KAI9484301.1 hypothetical protein BDB00DRAFT_984296 [Zychaea mexicana]
MTEQNTDEILTAVDIVDQQRQLEQEAQQVLPGKFEKCTYDQGYIRQALYSCKTCYPEEKDLAGFCYSCSIACHADHELFELFPKRCFRCDCGIGRDNNDNDVSRCTLHDNKESNVNNKYNHNFRGRYCRCDKDYDPDQEDGTMYQCVVCEDWFHDRCIGELPADVEDFESYVCRGCTKQHPFLIQKPDNWISIGLSKNEEKIHRWVTAPAPPTTTITSSSGSDTATVVSGQKRKLDQVEKDEKKDDGEINSDSSGKKQQLEQQCGRVTYDNEENVELFLKEGWRSHLCQCKECAHAYKDHKIEYLLSEEETFEPEEDEDAGKSLVDAGMEHIMRMDRVQAMESIMAYKALSSQIKDFLQTFKDSGEVVTESHIRQFFAEKRLELATKKQ